MIEIWQETHFYPAPPLDTTLNGMEDYKNLTDDINFSDNAVIWWLMLGKHLHDPNGSQEVPCVYKSHKQHLEVRTQPPSSHCRTLVNLQAIIFQTQSAI